MDNVIIWDAISSQSIFNIQEYQETTFIVHADASINFCHLIFNVGQESKLSLIVLNSAASDQKIILEINLNGKNAHACIKGAYVLQDNQKLHIKTIQNHKAQSTQSTLILHGIVSDSAQAFYDGMIEIAQNAHGSIACQQNKNILLSSQAKAESKPNLQVHTNDVRCMHGSAVGQLDSIQLFYLAARGIEPQKAKQLLLQGFLSYSIDQVPTYVITHIQKQLNQLCQK